MYILPCSLEFVVGLWHWIKNYKQLRNSEGGRKQLSPGKSPTVGYPKPSSLSQNKMHRSNNIWIKQVVLLYLKIHIFNVIFSSTPEDLYCLKDRVGKVCIISHSHSGALPCLWLCQCSIQPLKRNVTNVSLVMSPLGSLFSENSTNFWFSELTKKWIQEQQIPPCFIVPDFFMFVPHL